MRTQLEAMLVLAVTTILLVTLLVRGVPPTVILTVLITLTVLIMVIGGAAKQLPEVLKVILMIVGRSPK
jgi:hypothetical protein